MHLAEHVDEADLVEQLSQPGPLFRQKTRILPVAAPVLQVDLPVRNVPVAADDHLAPAGAQFAQVRHEGFHEAELHRLALVAA